MKIFFDTFSLEHIPIFRKWLNQEHIKPFWQESEDDTELKDKFLVRLPKRGICCFMFRTDEVSEKTDLKNIDHSDKETNYLGFVQYYEASKVGGGWWENEKPGTYGIDLMIGEPNRTGKALGPKVIKEFMDFILAREKNVSSFIIDPDPKNVKGVRAFEKAGFVREREIVTPNGPTLLMRMKIK